MRPMQGRTLLQLRMPAPDLAFPQGFLQNMRCQEGRKHPRPGVWVMIVMGLAALLIVHVQQHHVCWKVAV